MPKTLVTKNKIKLISKDKVKLFIAKYPLEIKSESDWAKEFRVHRSTIARWKRDPDIKKEIENKIEEVIKASDTLMKIAYKRAVTRLIELLDSEDENIVKSVAQAIIGVIKNKRLPVEGDISFFSINFNEVKNQLNLGEINIEKYDKEIRKLEKEIKSVETTEIKNNKDSNTPENKS